MGSQEKKKQMNREFLVTMYTNCHFQLISVVKIKKNVAVDKKSSFIFCTQFGAQNAGNGISELSDFKIFWGNMPTDPTKLTGLAAPCSDSWLFLSNQLLLQILLKPPVLYLRIFFQTRYSYMKKITASLDVKFIIACTRAFKRLLATQVHV